MLLTALGSCSVVGRSAAPAPERRLTLFFSASLEGAVEPCGCAANMLGGLARAASVLQQARAEGATVIYLDAGDGLFPRGALAGPAIAQLERKALAIAQSLRAMGLAVRRPGAADDARGGRFRRDLGLPELEAGTSRLLDVGGARVAVVAGGSIAAAEALARAARRDGASVVVALILDSFEALRSQLGDASELDVVVAASARDALSGEQDRVLSMGATQLLQPQSKGRSLARVDLVLRGPGRLTWLHGPEDEELERRRLEERIELVRAQVDEPGSAEELRQLRQAKLEELIARRAAMAQAPRAAPPTGNLATVRFQPVEGTLPLEPTVAELQRAADRDIGELNLRWAQAHGEDCPTPSPQTPGFVGSEACGACHPEALAVWRATRHPRAYEALTQVGKQYDLGCVACHVAGWQRPGGVCRIDRTEHRREVGCESCHGPGSLHATAQTKASILRADSKELCVGCHDHENSPHFAYETYLPQILGPGHGAPKSLP